MEWVVNGNDFVGDFATFATNLTLLAIEKAKSLASQSLISLKPTTVHDRHVGTIDRRKK